MDEADSTKERTEIAPRWRCIGASVRGLSHEKSGLPCQDAHYIESPTVDMIIVAVADGAGSASLSDVGAAIAVQTAVRKLRNFVTEMNKTADFTELEAAVFDAVAAAKLAVEAEADARKVRARELASTLLLAIATPSLVVAAQIGDGGIVVKDTDACLTMLTSPELSEYINETCFLISPDALSRTQVQTWQGNTAQIAIFSDGLQLLCLKMPEVEPFNGFFVPIFGFAEKAIDTEQGELSLSNFLISKRIRENSDDDITLILATLNESPLCQSPSDLDQLAESPPLTHH